MPKKKVSKAATEARTIEELAEFANAYVLDVRIARPGVAQTAAYTRCVSAETVSRYSAIADCFADDAVYALRKLFREERESAEEKDK